MRATVSVLLPAYNAAQWLPGAIESILHQSLRELELIVIDDGSTDATAQVLARYSDPRLIVIHKKLNQGLVAALNEGIEMARGTYIARMDADDIAHRRRLELQATFLQAHPDIGICGSWFKLTGGQRRSTLRTPTNHDDISARLFFRSPFGHPTIVFRTAFLKETGMRYDPASTDAEDFDFWVRARKKTRFANLPRVLLYYRIHDEQTSARSKTSQSRTVVRIRCDQLAELVPGATDAEKEFHLRVSAPDAFSTKTQLLRAREWLRFLAETNRKAQLFTSRSFADALAHTWAYCCLRASLAPGDVVPTYLSGRFAPFELKAFKSHLLTISKLFFRPIVE